jgi:chloramphenicol O-acetyltransferase
MLYSSRYLISTSTLDNKQTVSNPETIKAAHGFFTARIANYYDSLPEAEKLKMEVVNTALDYYEDIESAAERFYRKISGESFDSLSPDLQAEFKEFVNSYFNEVDSFFKKNSPKYLW